MNFFESDFLVQLKYRSRKPVLIDIGAHYGTFSRPFARKGWTVIAFEPEYKNYKIYKRNLSGFKKVTCIPKAVSKTSGQRVPFYVSEEHYGIHSLEPFHDTHNFAYEVETISIDDAMAEQKINAVTLLKIDIEGADFYALQGFDAEKYCPELIMIEFMDARSGPHFGYTHHDVVDYMKQQGYVTYVSEWEPFKEYARAGVDGDPHLWVRCERYPLKQEPSWGNLLFVPENAVAQFEDSLRQYLVTVKKDKPAKRGIAIRRLISKIPGTQFILNKFCDLRTRKFYG